jgi:hypothetical protein
MASIDGLSEQEDRRHRERLEREQRRQDRPGDQQ